ncbi:magnesium and cobalt transport protein CorA [Candidatus Woesearchaeota archaeon CG_4_10_14_0_2_um_filter_33_13]|nr:MAG: magnesium and cobalt transport protein CorA [Candidatus Woesearchaeota archaeon CG_4_10_14_0_2_um_filter_33_13]
MVPIEKARKITKKKGLPPGTLVYVGSEKNSAIKVQILDYNEKTLTDKELKRIEDIISHKNKKTVTWVNIDGVHDLKLIERFGKHFDIHPLIQEDIVNTNQRPKFEEFEGYIYIVLRMITFKDAAKNLDLEQVSILLGNNFVTSFQERPGDVFEPIRQRIISGKGKIRKFQSDYLAYSLIDAIVDNYYMVLEKIGEYIEVLEEELLTNPTHETLNKIHRLKGDLIYLRKSVWPLRDVISSLQRSESKLIQESTQIFLRDVYDHTIQIIDSIETFRDMVTGMIDIYLSSVSNKMNEVMKVLTIFASIFIPLTFLVGVYGMNFHFMPELDWKWSYPILWIIMLGSAGTMVYFFRKRGWL